MSQTVKMLTIALAAQVLLIAFVNRGGDDLSAFHAQDALIKTKGDTITALTIEEKDKPALQLTKKDGVWIIPASNNFPVSAAKVNDIITRLQALKRSWPVAKTDAAHKQLKLTPDGFERKLTLDAGAAKETLILGTSPGFRKIHARLDGEDPVYAIELSSYELSTKDSDWFDKDLLKTPREKVSRIEFKGFAVKSGDTGFEVDGLADTEQTNRQEMDAFVSELTSLSYESLLGVEDKPDYKQAQPILEFSITDKDQKTNSFKVSGPLEESYVVKTSQYPYYLKTAKAKFDKVKEVTRERLVQAKPAPTPAQEVLQSEAPK